MNKLLHNFVGVIDSGVGGLTILQRLQRDFPACNYIYLADNAYCPYGIRQPQEIFSRVLQLIQFLQKVGAQAIVIACNTASVHVYELRRRFSLPIYDVIQPTCQRVAEVTKLQRVALLATNATVKSMAYQRQLKDVAVISFACSRLVPFVEANEIDSLECDFALNSILGNLAKCNVDTVILGCTHFPILRKKIAPFTCGAEIVECCTDFQPNNQCLGTVGETIYLTTGREEQINIAASWFGNVQFSHIDI